MPNWFNQHHFNKIPPTGFVLPSSGTEPAAAVTFELWGDTGTGRAKWRTAGGAWMAFDDVADAAVTDAKIAAGANISLSKLATNPLARSNHTGTQSAATISDLATTVKAFRLDEFAAPTAALNAGGQRWTNVGAPVNPNDGARLADVQAAAAGISVKPAVRAGTLVNIALTGLLTVDGVALQAGDRVLVKAQTDATQNGLYTAAASAWSRTGDAMAPNTFVFVSEGATLAETGWAISTNAPITVGSTAIAWAQFAGDGGGGGAGAGLVQNGALLDVVAADGSIVVNPDSLAVGLVPITKGGTGATTAAAARAALGVGGTYSADLPALTAGTWANITHSLNTVDIAEPTFRDLATGEFVRLDAKTIDANTVAVRAAVPVAANTLRITVKS
ncbi:hypothetical protein ACIHFD_49600 [Nonomuraea sp. NPDC051941]|uniref:hypothetical protein n=1 Tax=Nonomuraea sp. NPDC051941 TaxID=3364373 RepID=UPI0037CCABE2